MNARTMFLTLALGLSGACGAADDSGDPAGTTPPPRADVADFAPQTDESPARGTDEPPSDEPDTEPVVSPEPDIVDPDPGTDPEPGPAPDPVPARSERRTDWPRGLAWVRSNPMMVSGLTVQVDNVDAGFVNTYYDDFGANAVHLWTTGLPNRLGAWLAVPRTDHRWLTWLDNDGRSPANGAIAGGVPANSAGRIGFQVGDEPRTWDDFTAMRSGVAAVRAHDPDALVFLNMSHEPDELDRMMADQCGDDDFDIFSYDDYSMRQGSYEWLEYFRAWGLQCDKPYWRYISSYGDAGREFPSPSGMRWHGLVGLVYGYTGHSWFLYQIAPAHGLSTALFDVTGALNASRTPRFAVAADVNQQLRNYGRIITRLQSTDVRYISSLGGVAQPTSTSTWTVGAGGDPYLSGFTATGSVLQDALIGFFEDNFGERYIMLQNPNHEGGSFPVSSDDVATFTLTFDFSGGGPSVATTHVEHYSGTSGQVADVPLVDSSLQVSLQAGDVYLFKYATGAPWDF